MHQRSPPISPHGSRTGGVDRHPSTHTERAQRRHTDGVPMPDLVIRAGLVLDGTGAAPHTADIAIRDGHIAEVGRVRDRAHRVIDADGALVVPGLLALSPPPDIAHFDRNRSTHRAPGVTTTVETVPRAVATQEQLPELLAGIDRTALLIDRAFMIDHGQMRREVLGNKVRDHVKASEGDIANMGAQLAAAFTAGAVGVRSSVEGDPEELLSALTRARVQMLAETDKTARVTVFLAGHRDPDEVLDAARYLIRKLETRAVLVSSTEPIDDGEVLAALLPSSDADVAALWSANRTIAGPTINPLAILHAVSEETLPLSLLGLRWSAAYAAVGLTDRGSILSTNRADINILDHVHLAEDLTSGVVSTIVHGVEVVNSDELTGATPGGLATAGDV